jgi:hypothetical protein
MREWKYTLHAFIISTLDGDDWSSYILVALLPRKQSRNTTDSWMGPEKRKISCP